MAAWRVVRVAALVAALAAVGASAARAGAAAGGGGAPPPPALHPTGRQCTQSGDYPHHDGCSATIRAIKLPLAALAGRWYMWDLSNDAKIYYKALLGVPEGREVACPTLTATPAGPTTLRVNLCMPSRVAAGSPVRTTCKRYTVRRRSTWAAAPLLWAPVGRKGPVVGGAVKVLAAARFPSGALKSFVTYQCPAGNTAPRRPCVVNGPPEVVGVWTKVLSYPGVFAYDVMGRRGQGIEALNEFQQLDCPTFRV